MHHTSPQTLLLDTWTGSEADESRLRAWRQRFLDSAEEVVTLEATSSAASDQELDDLGEPCTASDSTKDDVDKALAGILLMTRPSLVECIHTEEK